MSAAKRVFINYRRKDTSGHAGRLCDLLRIYYPDAIFFDTGIESGERWDQEILGQLQHCEVLLAVIGPGWLTMAHPRSGRRLLDLPDDWVRREIETALTRNILVIPILVGGETLPLEDDLPDNIQELVYRQKYDFRHESAERDIKALVDRLAKVLGPPAKLKPKPEAKRADPSAYLNWLQRETGYIDIKGLQVGQQKAYRFPIQELYTPLTTAATPDGREQTERTEPVPLQDMLAAHPRIVLVGDPGAGKSTFLRYIAHDACQSKTAFPILISAASLSNFIWDTHPQLLPEKDSPHWLLHYLAWKSNESDWNLPPEFFTRQLKSGALLLIDGLDEASDAKRRKSLVRLLDKVPARCIVVTSRPSAYGGETAIPSFKTVQIAPLDDKAIDTFVANWCRALYPGDPAGAANHRDGLLDAIHSKPEVEAMSANPVMLTALAVLHWNEKRLPDQRADLYDSVLNWLAQARQEKPGRESPSRCLDLLQQLAYSMHADPKGMQVEIGPYPAAQAIAAEFRGLRPDQQTAKASEFLEAEELESGILAARGNKLRYWHRTFQEYLAARALGGREEDRLRLLFKEEKLYLNDWRETVLLLAGVLKKQDTARIDGFLREMLDGAESGPLLNRARCVGLIGHILQDLKAWKYEIADPRYGGWLTSPEMLSLFFDPKMPRSMDFQIRLDVADALGQVGDPRLHESQKWVHPRGAKFLVGRYPVTVSEYAEYIRKGNGTEPYDWRRQLRYPNRPVVGIDWHQASAYCEWAKGRLPTEEEWLIAARDGTGDIEYPWGSDDPDEYKANYWHQKSPQQATPVGMYPEGATPSGIFDLAGNVWEWSQDWYDEDRDTKVLRGGAWLGVPQSLRLSGRLRDGPVSRFSVIGFRCFR